MGMISAFTFIRNALHGGYPLLEAIAAVHPYVDETVVLDMGSDDGTYEILHGIAECNPRIRVHQMEWDVSKGPAILGEAHAKHAELCQGDVIVHMEADEIYDRSLIESVVDFIKIGNEQQLVWRLQVEQNFSRCRWYPTPCHRVFRKGTVTKRGHSTVEHLTADLALAESFILDPVPSGFLWDVTNCFRDQWWGRLEQNAELWNQGVQPRLVPLHAAERWDGLSEEQANEKLREPHWTFRKSPFDLPELLKFWVGQEHYFPRESLIDALASGKLDKDATHQN